VLLVEDSPSFAFLVEQYLALESKDTVEVEHVELLSKAVEVASAREFELVIIDLSLPDSDCGETLRFLRPRPFGIPVLAMSGAPREACNTEDLEAGTDGFIEKRNIDGERLWNALQKCLSR